MTQQRSPAAAAAGGGGGTPALHYLSGPYGDTTYTKVFVGGLAWETRNEGLRAHFGAYGDILEAVVITDRATGRSKGYGFVTFRDPESAKMACMDPYPVIDGRRANCNLAILGRPGPAVPFDINHHKNKFSSDLAPLRPVIPYNGGVAVPGGMYMQSPTYQQPPYNYPQAFVYPSYGPSTYGPEYLYPQNAYGSYVGQQYVPAYGGPRTVGPAVYPYGQMLLMLYACQRFSNNIAQEHHALSNSSWSLFVHNSHQTTYPSKRQADKFESAAGLRTAVLLIGRRASFLANCHLLHSKGSPYPWLPDPCKCDCQAAPLEGARKCESWKTKPLLHYFCQCMYILHPYQEF
ncbi:hypothetical protein GUJ93_ZPchr0012g21890 [Zizania palustris]|uniref:RRM domain-containing protein n=1 Tax=Zizania palustris TaxID=103762 RepID=A0A8J5WR04_ZIZPA|nr:hypothetical protein GUJ93_ZPchr0012g21890 [Zizania palustris]